MAWLQNLGNNILNALPNILAAILILIVAFVVAKIAEWLVNKLIKWTNLDDRINRWGLSTEESGTTVGFIGKLVFILVFILFLPAVFARLGLSQVATPINDMVTGFFSFIPNLLAAALILVVGFFVAKVIRQLLTPLLAKLGVDRIQEKAGVSSSGQTKLSTVLGYVVYVLILIPVIIAALETLNIRAISVPATNMLNIVFDFIPKLFVAIIIVLIGVFVGKLVGDLVTGLLSGVGADQFVNRIMPDGTKKPNSFSVSGFLGKLVTVLIVLFLTVEALNVLELDVLTNIGAGVIAYLPMVLAAILIMGAAIFLAQWLGKLIEKRVGPGLLPTFVKSLIIVVAVFMSLEQLHIANAIVVTSFQLFVAGLALAFALSFGLGGREFAARSLKKMEDKTDELSSQADNPGTDRTNREF